MTESAAHAHVSSRRHTLVSVAALQTVLLAAACANPTGTLLILQNQVPVPDSASSACIVPTDPMFSRSSGLFDIDLDRPYPYFVYPLMQSRLPSIRTSGGIERNFLLLRGVRVEIRTPSGIDPGWQPGCPGTFESPATAVLEPGQVRAVVVEGFQPCHATRLKELVAAGAIPGDLSQPVFFTLSLTAVVDRGGAELRSDAFPFQVQVCAGCLQSLYPLTPTCADAPKPNPLRGNPCNIAQDGPQVLCCTNPAGALVCPAPDV